MTRGVWLSSDLHLGHRNIASYVEARRRAFKDVEDMDKGIIGRFNAEIGYGDKLILLGDLCMGSFEDSLARLGKLREDIEVWLIPGNHDRWSLAYGHRGSEEEQAAKSSRFYQMYEEALGSRGHVVLDRAGGWRGWELGLEGEAADVIFCHYPVSGESEEGREDRYDWLRPDPAQAGAGVIGGHVHDSWITDIIEGVPHVNVGVDVWDYRPVPLQSCLNLLAILGEEDD